MSDKKTTNNFNDLYETFRKGTCEIVTNLRAHYGDKGAEVANQVMEAFDRAIKATKEDFDTLKADAKRKGEELSPKLESALTYLDQLLKGDVDGSKHSCCNGQCGCGHNKDHKCTCGDNCKCKNSQASAETKTVEATPCDALNEDGMTYSTALINQKHGEYMNGDAYESPLWAAISRRLDQDVEAAKKEKEKDTEYVDPTEEDVDELMTILDEINDSVTALMESDAPANEFCEYVYDCLMDYLDDNKENENVHTVLATATDDDHIAITANFDKFPIEIKQRIVDNTDNGLLREHLACYLDMDIEYIDFDVRLNANSVIVKIYPDDGEFCED